MNNSEQSPWATYQDTFASADAQAKNITTESGVPICYYIASNNKSEALSYLKSKGINVPQPQSVKLVARGLRYVIQNGSEKDLQDILNLHPDKSMFADSFHSVAGDKIIPEIPATPVQSNSNADSSVVEPMFSVKTTYTLLGVALTLTTLTLIKFVTNNIKS